jgi:L-threonylcarbamoyladenylate synthase
VSIERTDLRGFAQARLGAGDLADRLAVAIAAARAGRPIVYPTETVYGVGSGLSESGVAAVRAAKVRSDDKPVLALVDGADAVPDLEWTDEARELAEAFWPGALTLVLRDPTGLFPPGVRSPAGTVAVRHTPHPIAAALVRGLGAPLTSSSANRPGDPPATDSDSATAFAESLVGLVDPRTGTDTAAQEPHLVDVGRLPPAASSTLVDCTVHPPRVLREGSIPTERLTCVLPELR